MSQLYDTKDEYQQNLDSLHCKYKSDVFGYIRKFELFNHTISRVGRVSKYFFSVPREEKRIKEKKEWVRKASEAEAYAYKWNAVYNEKSFVDQDTGDYYAMVYSFSKNNRFYCLDKANYIFLRRYILLSGIDSNSYILSTDFDEDNNHPDLSEEEYDLLEEGALYVRAYNTNCREDNYDVMEDIKPIIDFILNIKNIHPILDEDLWSFLEERVRVKAWSKFLKENLVLHLLSDEQIWDLYEQMQNRENFPVNGNEIEVDEEDLWNLLEHFYGITKESVWEI